DGREASVRTPRSSADAGSGGVGGEHVERSVRVGQVLRVDDGAAADEVLDGGGDVPDVGVHAGDDEAGGEPEGHELAAGGVAPEDDPIPGRGVARVLNAEVVLVGEEVGDPVV